MSPNSKGESIIEIVIVSFFLVTALVAFVSLTMMSVARNRLAKERVVATRLTQEGVEWFRSERDRQGFDVLESKITGTSYCIADVSGSFPGAPCNGTCQADCAVTANSRFSRWIELDPDTTQVPAQIDLTVQVGWAGQLLSQKGVLKQWEK